MGTSRRSFLWNAGVAALAAVGPTVLADADRPNVLLLTADDMSWDSLGCTGCPLPGISPHLDRLAADGLLVENCHIITPICGPSRNALHTGQYPARSGCMGHGTQPPLWWKKQERRPTEGSIENTLRNAGYLTGVIGKHGSKWCRFDVKAEGYGDTGMGRDPSKYYTFTKEFLARAKTEKKPFYLNANAHDPHRYWARHPSETQKWIDKNMKKFPEHTFYPNGKPYPDPKTDFDPKVCPMPACYPDEPWLKERISTYYDSVNRMDEVMGEILRALEESGMADNTLVVFLSDHGMGWLMSKWALYPSGTKTPLIARWPGKISPGQIDSRSVVSAVDIPATLVDACDCGALQNIDGMSFRCLLDGDPLEWKRTEAFSCFNYMNNSAELDKAIQAYEPNLFQRHEQYRPSRGLSSIGYTYIWNGWADGKTELPGSMGANSEIPDALGKNAENPNDKDYPDYAQRLQMALHRVPEELYDTQRDPGCLRNLAADPEHHGILKDFRAKMLNLLGSTGDQEMQNYRGFLRK